MWLDFLITVEVVLPVRSVLPPADDGGFAKADVDRSMIRPEITLNWTSGTRLLSLSYPPVCLPICPACSLPASHVIEVYHILFLMAIFTPWLILPHALIIL